MPQRTYRPSFEDTLLLCKSMGIAALFIGWGMFPLGRELDPLRPGQTYTVRGELQKITPWETGVYQLRVDAAEVDGRRDVGRFEWVTHIPADRVALFVPGSRIQWWAPRRQGLFRHGKPFTWQFAIDGRTVMPFSEGYALRRQEVMVHRRKALNVLGFGIAMLIATHAIGYRFRPHRLNPGRPWSFFRS